MGGPAVARGAPRDPAGRRRRHRRDRREAVPALARRRPGVGRPDGGGETIGGDAVVLATGAAVPGAVEPLGLRMPDATSSALLVRAAPVATGLRAVLNTPRVAVRPAPGGGLVVDAGWAEREVERRPDGTYRVGASTVDGLLREASAVLAGNPALRSVGHGAGAKPIPGDGEPVVGAVPGVRGLHIAFTHSGATLGLVAGDLLAQEVLTGRRDPLLAGFGPERFA
ncbi:FAD-dependent oxidoreductase [Cellulomonas sp. ATA003]|nr:FAD-dependent oxidoreductase [Cellulomonas sp. ATA003]WNB84404.1 FAD-dependent oxidoreductase [Cellulomonas sp. ATA003]